MELVIFVGLQASGKTSFYNIHFKDSHVLISKDRFPNAKNKARRQTFLIREALSNGRSVVVDNTNPDFESRAPIIATGKEFCARVVGYYFQSRLVDCLERNSAREGKSRISDVGLRATAKKLVIPTLEEGFDELHYVRIGENGQFALEDWNEDLAL